MRQKLSPAGGTTPHFLLLVVCFSAPPVYWRRQVDQRRRAYATLEKTYYPTTATPTPSVRERRKVRSIKSLKQGKRRYKNHREDFSCSHLTFTPPPCASSASSLAWSSLLRDSYIRNVLYAFWSLVISSSNQTERAISMQG